MRDAINFTFSVEFYSFCFSCYAYIEFNLCKITLHLVNNVWYLDLDIVWANYVIVKWRW
jgi:hypothetical protein